MAVLLNPRAWLALALAAFLAFTHAFACRGGKASVRADFDAYKTQQSEQRILADGAQRNEETRRQVAIDKEAKDAHDRIAALESDVGAARAGADRLHAAIAAAVRTGKDPKPATGGQGKPGADALDLLALVLVRTDDAAGAISEYADRLLVVGIACERSYDALTVKP
ncbi:DUF2514 family protein [Variovorax sp. dw_308]|uniref:DUF2514 family protein n=1 Tax=Variovorax sp. dw_308 TaxID=2721546 RepID=UPI001C44660F|nr:DUF2514 family protein [Variovorax sp. dw_308]